MVEQSNVQERRKINEEIEDAYISATQASANCVTALATGKGNYPNIYRDFFQYFYHLFDLTHDIKEIAEKEEMLCTQIDNWFLSQTNLSQKPETHIIKLIREGNEFFRRYKKSLSSSGIISLPTTRR